MIKRFLLILVLIFSFQSWTRADDIRDFQIEGMSIGDSLLDYFSEEEIKNYSDDIGYASFGWLSFGTDNEKLRSKLKQYDYIQIEYMEKDKDYKIYALSGKIYDDDNFELDKCIKKAEKISNQIKEVLGKSVKYQHDKKTKLEADKSGKSISDTRYFIFDDGAFVSVRCSDWSQEETNYEDLLSVDVVTKKFRNMMNEAYK